MRGANSSGFTLIEAVVATAVMVTVVATIAHVVLMSAEQSTAARRNMELLVLAQSKLEELRAWPGALVSGNDRVGDSARSWLVTPVDAGEPRVLLIRVCVDASSTCVATVRATP